MKLSEIIMKPWTWLTALLMYLLLIFMLSHLSADQLRIIPFSYWDKLVHFLEYLPVGFLITGLLQAKWPAAKAYLIVSCTIAVVVFLAGLDEYHQSFVPGRDVSFGDGIADTIGGAAGALVCIVFLKFSLRRATISEFTPLQ